MPSHTVHTQCLTSSPCVPGRHLGSFQTVISFFFTGRAWSRCGHFQIRSYDDSPRRIPKCQKPNVMCCCGRGRSLKLGTEARHWVSKPQSQESSRGQGRIKLFGAPRQWKHFRPLFEAVFLSGGGGYYPPDWVKHQTFQSQDRNNKYFILYIESVAADLLFRLARMRHTWKGDCYLSVLVFTWQILFLLS